MIQTLYRHRLLGHLIRMANRLIVSTMIRKGLAFRKPNARLEKIGSEYGGWVIPVERINEKTICYCGGVGEDLSFDAGLIERFDCFVFAFDPTPRSISFVRRNAPARRFKFYPWGLWDEETTLKFFEPKDPTHVSHSVVNLQKTSKYFEAFCKPISKIAEELGHKTIGLLKIDIEGAEFAVIGDIIRHEVLPDVLCVEFDQPCSPFRVYRAIRDLANCGLELIAIDNWNFTFERSLLEVSNRY